MIDIGKLSQTGKNIILEEQASGCIYCISHCKDDDGYTRIRYNGKHERLFRVLYSRKYGDIPHGMLIRHKCDDPACCNINHLELGTPKDNVSDMIKRGRSRYTEHKPWFNGTNNKQSKLSDEDVVYIFKSPLSNGKLSKQFGVSKTTISNIKNKKYWVWLTKDL